MSTRTPGPWRWDRHPHSWPNCDRPSEGDHVPILYKDDEGLDRPDPGIRVASFSDTPWHKASELATFIVEACNAHDTLTAENEALREALLACITDEGAHCYQTGSVHALDCRIKGINAEARAALALADGAK